MFYDPGVGTFSSKAALTALGRWVTRTLGSALGFGVSENIADAYEFLMEHYRVGDRIFIFGFSRGAYTARAIAGLIHVCGLLHRQDRNLVSYTIELYLTESAKAMKAAKKEEKRTGKRPRQLDLSICDKFKSQFSRQPTIHFLGLWDTVTSVGTFRGPLNIANTTWNPSVAVVRHAISIDERRKFFRQNLWRPADGQDVKQVWFAGVHADVGGGYAERESGLSKIALAWMLEEAEHEGLGIDAGGKGQVLPLPGVAPPPTAPDPGGSMHDELKKCFWRFTQLLPKTVQIRDPTTGAWKGKRSWSPCPKPRFIADKSRVHHTVFERIKSYGYDPMNLPVDVLDEHGHPVDWSKAIGRNWPGRRS